MKSGTDKSLSTVWRIALLASVLVLTSIRGTSFGSAKKKPVDINTASQAELQAVKGIGAATAKKIIANRPYKSVEDLSKAGLSAKKIKHLKSSITVGTAPSASETTRGKRKKGEPEAAFKTKEPKTATPQMKQPVDLNTASLEALETLPGVGRTLAKRIIAARPFRSFDDLGKVKGMSKARLEGLKDKVTLAKEHKAGPAASVPTPESSAKPAEAAKNKAPAGKPIPGQKVDINTASKEELDKIPGIGPARAQAIVDGRPYHRIEDVMKVKGIKQHTFDRIKAFITVK